MNKQREIKYQAAKHERLNRYFYWIQAEGFWWNHNLRQWQENVSPGCSNSMPCKTVKAFKRALRKHPHIVGKATLCNRYKGCDVYG